MAQSKELRIKVNEDIYEQIKKGDYSIYFKIGHKTYPIETTAQYSYYFECEIKNV